jgi:hypothetical protein
LSAAIDKENTVVEKLRGAEISILQRQRNLNDNGWLLRTSVGAIVHLYDDGKVSVQGKKTWSVRRTLGLAPERRSKQT